MMNSLLLPRSGLGLAATRRCLIALVLLAPFALAGRAAAQSVEDGRCGVLNPPGQYGPYDYRTATREQKYLVEIAHFAPEVELLTRGQSGARPGPDIDYTLRALPNHPRALKSMMDLGIREHTNRPFGAHWTVECYFNRAVRFAPDDPQVRMLFGIFLLKNGEKQSAIQQLEVARTMGAGSGNFQYNLGLAYFQVQDYEKARQQAYKARELGYDLDGLKNLLTRAGQWKEPPPKAAESTEPAAPAPASGEDPAAKN
jgi:tetratricopeptide (TPR) repeat protein